MLKKLTAHIAMSLFIGGCTQQLSLMTLDQPANCPQQGLAKSICQADKKAQALTEAYFEWYHDPAIFDIPLIALAGAGAGLLLFDITGSALKGVAVAGGSAGVAGQYFSLAEVRTGLLDAADGYSCLVDAGMLALPAIAKIKSKEMTAASLNSQRIGLEFELADPNSNFPDRERANRAVKKAVTTWELYKKQKSSAASADKQFRESARSMSVGLLKRLQRKEVDFSSIFQSIAKKAASVTRFSLEKESAEPGPSDASLADPVSVAQLTKRSTPAAPLSQIDLDIRVRTLEALIAVILADLPNVEALSAEFGECAARGITGAKSGSQP